MVSYRVTFRSADRRGTADYVRDINAVSMGKAIEQATWQLHTDHPHDHERYRCVMAVEIERERPEITGVPA